MDVRGACKRLVSNVEVSIEAKWNEILLTDSLPCAATSTTTTGLYTVFLEVSIVSMTRTRVQVRLGVILGSLVLIPHNKSNGRAQRNSMLYSGLDMHKVLLVSLSTSRQAVGGNKCH